MAATLDIVARERLLLGMGAAWNERDCGAYGIDLGDVRARLDRFEEGVEVVARLLRDETTTFDGDYYHLDEARCSPKPIQRPYPPITIGGTGERRTARIVARWADHWDLGFTQPADVPGKVAALAEHCDAVGRNCHDITISAVVGTAHGTSRRELREVACDIERYAAAGCDLVLVEALAPDPDGTAAEIERLTRVCLPLVAA
jgi:alkanesulfonate monooxygenase SsuD/methylene tetrahydromethanopterin reductase-like flavin-dependent oxidoreductase (luciferase family)